MLHALEPCWPLRWPTQADRVGCGAVVAAEAVAANALASRRAAGAVLATQLLRRGACGIAAGTCLGVTAVSTHTRDVRAAAKGCSVFVCDERDHHNVGF